MTTINGYKLIGELNNANSGFSKWGFATKGRKEFFIKELITPVYPIDDEAMSPEYIAQKRAYCDEYERNFRDFYKAINEASHGTLVRIVEFFRFESRYYVVTEKINGISLFDSSVQSLPLDKKLLFLKTIVLCFCDLHSANIVHFDVKPNNILVKRTDSGNYCAKLIDFDSGFLKGKVISVDELCGDLTYLAPEVFLAIIGQTVHLDEKADIYSLGLVLHEYLCGKLPNYDTNEFEYPYEAALENGKLICDDTVQPSELQQLITSMLDANPDNRPSSWQIFNTLNSLCASLPPVFAPPETAPVYENVPSVTPSPTPATTRKTDDWFSSAGDL